MRGAIYFISFLFVTGCAGVVRNPLPADEYLNASVLGRQDLRFWGDEDPPEEWLRFAGRNQAEIETELSGVMHKAHHYLAISGGGANGAYGAGALVGWTQEGSRPEFSMVTGISTGALIAPFAFLGPRYDSTLREVYTSLDTKRIFKLRNIFTLIISDSIVDVTPLKQVLEEYITEELIDELAEEYRRGRILLIGTTNLDASRPVIWNVTRIAASGEKGSVELVRKIMLASASIPGAFPPVYISVQAADGQHYDEMHVDGGTSSQIFLYPPDMDWAQLTEILDVRGTPQAYLLRNSYVREEYSPVSPRLLPIASKTVNSLIRTQGIGDAYRIYTLAERDNVDVQLSWIPQGAVSEEPDEAFDPDYMSALFEYGYRRGESGSLWMSVEDAINRK